MSAPFWTLERVRDALRSLLVERVPAGDAPIAGISTDTRDIRPGDCFVALAGERFDAHDFLAGAVAQGASALVVSRPGDYAALGVPVFRVGDTLMALGALARYRRRAWAPNGRVIGVGGSNGKTTTKELIRGALSAKLRVHATRGNLNNLVGVPKTLLALPDDAEAAVVEMGMNVPGEMERLVGIVEPDVSVVTCIAEEHLEGLGDMEGVMREESFIFDGAHVAIVPASQPEVARAAQGRAGRVIAAGLGEGDLRAERWGVERDGHVWLEVEGVTVRPRVRGVHNLRNTMLALAVARECGVGIADAARGVESAEGPAMRMAWENVGRATLINDAYNASPASMRAALALLSELPGGRQRVAVLGTMRELGAHSARLHQELAREALDSPIEVLAGAGEMGDALHRAGAGDSRLVVADDIHDLWTALRPRLHADAVILLKASRGVELERLVPSITAWANS
ncbi:MAG TPA: UDP-N-acetylmuramoyl-tripeptide--D-alanyl-D-alanine ligase [Gemmatimonadaceae bacterium]|nr:UDP-N-acetylmuramoyl-tripeptide--D-alanyl-D-alanine ligase [Gemmatimonadaceae bacterium]